MAPRLHQHLPAMVERAYGSNPSPCTVAEGPRMPGRDEYFSNFQPADSKLLTDDGADAECYICKETFDEDHHRAVILHDKHFAGETCLRTWLKDNATCPMCRKVVYGRNYLFEQCPRMAVDEADGYTFWRRFEEEQDADQVPEDLAGITDDNHFIFFFRSEDMDPSMLALRTKRLLSATKPLVFDNEDYTAQGMRTVRRLPVLPSLLYKVDHSRLIRNLCGKFFELFEPALAVCEDDEEDMYAGMSDLCVTEKRGIACHPAAHLVMMYMAHSIYHLAQQEVYPSQLELALEEAVNAAVNKLPANALPEGFYEYPRHLIEIVIKRMVGRYDAKWPPIMTTPRRELFDGKK